MPAAAQQSLLDLLEQSIVVAKRAKETRTETTLGVASLNPERPAKPPNPFRKQTGDCNCGAESVRIFWCHICGKTSCWDCFAKHLD